MTYRIGPDLIGHYEDEPSGPFCKRCGNKMDWEDCGACEDGYSYHDCGEDCCCCADPEPNVKCEQCGGDGGWWVCMDWSCRKD